MRQNIVEDGGKGLEDLPEQVMGLFSASPLPFVRNIVLAAPLFIDLLLIFRFNKTLAASLMVGSLISEHLLWFMLPVLLNGILCSYSRDYLEKVMKKEDIYHGGMRIISSVKQYLCTILPMVCILSAIYPLLGGTLFYPQFRDFSGTSYSGGIAVLAGCFIALFCLSGLICSLLRGADRELASVLCGLTACVVQTICAVILLKGEVSLINLFTCGLIYALILLVGAFGCLFPFCVYRKKLTSNLVMPVVASVAALVTALLCQFLKNAVGGLLAACLAIVVSFLVHSVTLVVMGCARKGDEFPQGAFLSLIAGILGIDS